MNEQDKSVVTNILQAAGRYVGEENLRTELGTDGRVTLLNLGGCEELRELPPEIGQVSQLKTLSLLNCRNLTALPSEIGQLSQLEELYLNGCRNLTTLPPEIGQVLQLKTLSLLNCRNLTTLPPEIGQLSQLKKLHLNGCRNLTTLPPEIGQLSQLEELYLNGCRNLTTLPPEIGQLSQLKKLHLNGCRNLTTLPPEIGQLSQLEELSLRGCENLKELYLHGCGNLLLVPEFVELRKLEKLSVNRNQTMLPPEIRQLLHLKELDLSYCRNLMMLPAEIGDLKQMKLLNLSYCSNIMTLPIEIKKLSQLKKLDLSYCSSLELPAEIEQFLLQLDELNLYGCENLTNEQERSAVTEILQAAGKVVVDESVLTDYAKAWTDGHVYRLNLSGFDKLKKLPPVIGQLSRLKVLDLSGCENLTTLPSEIGMLSHLKKLDLSDCKALEKLPDSLLQLDLTNLALRGTKLQAIQVFESGDKCWVVASDNPTISRNFSGINQFMLVSRDFSGTLDLSNSTFSGLPNEIVELTKLKELDISNNDNIKEVPELQNCRNLEKVNIKDCEYSTKLLGSLDATLKPKNVSWEDRPPYQPKLLIKFVICSALFAMAIFTIYKLSDSESNKDKFNKCIIETCNELCVNLEDPRQICQICKITLCRDKLPQDGLSHFKIFVAVLSIFLLLPHVVDVGNMMDQFLQVPFSGKFHKILERQEKLAERIDELTVWRYNVYGLLGSLANALCCFWCTRPWDVPFDDVPHDMEQGSRDLERNHSLERKCPKYVTYIVDEIYHLFQCISNPEFGWFPPCISNLEWGRLWVIIVEWLDTALTLVLLPLSWYVITNSSTVIDVLVNVVSVSVFARLDDEAVEMFTKPQQSLLDRWRLYTGSEDDLRHSGMINVERREGNVEWPADAGSEGGNVEPPTSDGSKEGNDERPTSGGSEEGNVERPTSGGSEEYNVEWPTRAGSKEGNVERPTSAVSKEGNVEWPTSAGSEEGNVEQGTSAGRAEGNVEPPTSADSEDGNVEKSGGSEGGNVEPPTSADSEEGNVETSASSKVGIVEPPTSAGREEGNVETSGGSEEGNVGQRTSADSEEGNAERSKGRSSPGMNAMTLPHTVDRT